MKFCGISFYYKILFVEYTKIFASDSLVAYIKICTIIHSLATTKYFLRLCNTFEQRCNINANMYFV